MANSSECLEKTAENIFLFFALSCITATCTIFLEYAKSNIELFIKFYNNVEYKYKVVAAFFQGTAEYSLVMFIVGIAKKYINIPNTMYKYLSKTSFA